MRGVQGGHTWSAKLVCGPEIIDVRNVVGQLGLSEQRMRREARVLLVMEEELLLLLLLIRGVAAHDISARVGVQNPILRRRSGV